GRLPRPHERPGRVPLGRGRPRQLDDRLRRRCGSRPRRRPRRRLPMSTTTLTSGAPAPAQHRPGTLGVAHTVTFGRLVRAEWIQVRALRSTYWTLGAAAFLHGLIPTLLGFAVQLTNEEGSATTPADSFALLGFGTSLSVF